MLQAGQTFGRYTIEDLLGQGGMGQVYRAQDNRLHRRVALKVLLAQRGDEGQWEEAKARMLREARIAAALEHPNAVSIYDLGAVDGVPFIAMEYVPGQNLCTYVGDANTPWELKLRWLIDAAGALAAAHDAGLVHRDVKPENVMVREDGRVKVLDFGIARRAAVGAGGADATGPQGAVPTLTGHGVIVGTLRYMPPEQLAGKPLDGRADQFAWAVMSYELFAGEAPWPAQTDIVATVTAILTAPPPPLFDRATFLPEPVVSAIHRALSKAPEERFATMRDLVATLELYAAPPAAHSSVPPRPAAAAASIPVLPVSSSMRSSDAGAPTAAALGTDGALAVDRLPSARHAARSRAARYAAAGVAAAIVTGLCVFLGLRGHRAHALAPPGAGASAPVVTVLDLPVSASSVPAAAVAYRAGLQAEHDANREVATSSFLEAATKDPGMGAAHLRYAMIAFFYHTVEAHSHFLKATELRSTLTAHDSALLDALAPLFDKQPPDWSASERQLDAASRQEPKDAELLYELSWVRLEQNKHNEAIATADAALALDPRFVAALYAKLRAFQAQGDTEGVARTAEQCLEAAPQAATCLHVRLQTYANAGRCESYEQDARRLIAINPDDSEGYEGLAGAAFALGRPLQGVLEPLRNAWKHSGDDAAWSEASDRTDLDALLGDRAELDKWLDAMDRVAEKGNDGFQYLNAAWARVEELSELGALDRAARVAGDFLDRRDSWQNDPGMDAQTIAFDVVPVMSRALARGGKIADKEFRQRRDAWIAGWRQRVSPEVAPYLWIYGYAQTTTTPAEAEEAMAALPEYSPLPPYRSSFIADAAIGRTFLLAGRVGDAIPLLERATSRCDPFEDPFAYVHASLWLGEAREAEGKKDLACDSYQRVIKLWSGFGPKSVSLREARAKAAALACPAVK
jgi:eukaryotic-like serine/threonine-protein kinase